MEPFLLLVLLIIQAGISCHARNNHLCAPSACGEIRNLSYPFKFKDDPKGYGEPRLELACEGNRMVLLSLYAGQYHVKSISPHYELMEVVDVGLRKSNCSSLPLHLLMSSNFSGDDDQSYFPGDRIMVTILSCSKPARSRLYIDTKPCITINGYYSYAVIDARASEIQDFCTISTSILAAESLRKKRAALSRENRTISFNGIHNAMANGFNLSYWVRPHDKAFIFAS